MARRSVTTTTATENTSALYDTLAREAGLTSASEQPRRSILSGRKAFASLEENTTYKVMLQSFTITEAPEEQRTEQNLGYVTFKWLMPEDGRIITDTRSVPMGTDILAKQLLDQFIPETRKRFSGVEQEELFSSIMDNQIQVNMWVQKVTTEDARFFTNHVFAKPLTPVPNALTHTTQQPAQRMNLQAPTA